MKALDVFLSMRVTGFCMFSGTVGFLFDLEVRLRTEALGYEGHFWDHNL